MLHQNEKISLIELIFFAIGEFLLSSKGDDLPSDNNMGVGGH